MRPAFVEEDRLSAVIHLVGQEVWDGIVIDDLLESARLGQRVTVLLAYEVQRLLNGQRRLPLDVSYINEMRLCVLVVRLCLHFHVMSLHPRVIRMKSQP